MVAEEKGSISIHTENIFPIIKKFLYSDHEIFLRELVSNGIDAIQKLKRLSSMGETESELGELNVTVKLDNEAKTITVSDNGVGMTAEEIRKYINQIAFSGATEFVNKYKDATDAKSQLIGHFGLGFYSAFMVSRQVEIQTLSHQADAEAAYWSCDGSTEFTIGPGTRETRGTDIILHLAEDSYEFLSSYRLKEILQKYGKFLPVPVFFENEQINDTSPLWTRNPAELTDQDYIDFYKKLYPGQPEPLFWIHLNVDYPFNLTGVLYFPPLRQDMELQTNKIQLYSRQVFITDDVKDVVPEFLMLLHGILDSPDIPLNVSRSFLQADGNVKKINSHISKKVADKLQEIFNTDRENFQNKYGSIGPIMKLGIMRDDRFWERTKDIFLLQTLEGKYFTIEEFKEKTKATQTDKDGELVWLYATHQEAMATYIAAAQRKGYEVINFTNILDISSLSSIEGKMEEEKVIFKRVDAASAEKLIEKAEQLEVAFTEAEQETLKAIFKPLLKSDKANISVEALGAEDMPVQLTQNEFGRRMREMYASQGIADIFGSAPMYDLVLNASHPIISKLVAAPDSEGSQQLARHAYDLALLTQHNLTGEALAQFVDRSLALLASQVAAEATSVSEVTEVSEVQG